MDYHVWVRNDDDGSHVATVLEWPACEGSGRTEGEAVHRARTAIERVLATGHLVRITVDDTEPPREVEFSDEELETLTPDDPRFWEVFETIGHRLEATWRGRDLTLEKWLASLPEAGEAWFREEYGDELADEIKTALARNSDGQSSGVS
jgi:predicted RNase H-like HicB family nuclease